VQKKIILIGELILDKNLFIRSQGKAAEFNSPKNVLLKSEINLGGAGMVYNALAQISKNLEFFSITNYEIKNKIINKLKKKKIF